MHAEPTLVPDPSAAAHQGAFIIAGSSFSEHHLFDLLRALICHQLTWLFLCSQQCRAFKRAGSGQLVRLFFFQTTQQCTSVGRAGIGAQSMNLLASASQVARIVLLEQLYRGWTILRGEPYHH